jgi:hypothetical protein
MIKAFALFALSMLVACVCTVMLGITGGAGTIINPSIGGGFGLLALYVSFKRRWI